jgi:hypothetical protein
MNYACMFVRVSDGPHRVLELPFLFRNFVYLFYILLCHLPTARCHLVCLVKWYSYHMQNCCMDSQLIWHSKRRIIIQRFFFIRNLSEIAFLLKKARSIFVLFWSCGCVGWSTYWSREHPACYCREPP